jgi:hypothetical protein
LKLPKCHERVGGFAGLRDEKADVIAEDWRLAIQEIRSKLDHDWKLSHLFEQLTSGDTRVERSAARDQDDAPASFQLGNVIYKATEDNSFLKTASRSIFEIPNLSRIESSTMINWKQSL